jgi:hypothetical protein
VKRVIHLLLEFRNTTLHLRRLARLAHGALLGVVSGVQAPLPILGANLPQKMPFVKIVNKNNG